MKTLLGLLCICVGVWLFHSGWVKRESFKGKTQAMMADVARSFDGSTRVPEHNWYMIAGGVSVLAGLAVIYAGRKR